MAETNAKEILDGENKAEENKTPEENLTAPAAADFTDTGGGDIPGEQPGQTEAEAQQTDTPGQEQGDNAPSLDIPAPDVADTPPAPEADGKPLTPQEELLKSLNDKVNDFQKKQDAPEAEKAAEQDAGEKAAPAKQRRGRQPTSFNPKVEHKTVKAEKEPHTDKTDKSAKEPKADKPEKPKRGGRPPKTPKEDKTASVGGGGTGSTSGQTPANGEKPALHPFQAREAEARANQGETPPAPEAPPAPEPPRDANRINETETIVYLDHSEIHPFKNHPFQVRDDDSMKSLIESVKERGVDQAALVRRREGGGYEMVAGHRRQAASIAAGIKNLPCVVRVMTDEEAVLAMTESNFTYRSEILASERAKALSMQLNAIKRQGARFDGVAKGDVGKRSNEIVAERNKMGAKVVQRYIALNNLVPDMMKLVDDKKIPFMAAFEMSYIKPKNQDYIAMTIDTQGSAPSLAQAQRMRELDGKGVLNGDVIDGIMLEEKKEDRKVIISSQELDKYFGAEKSPKEMKETILKLLDEYKVKNPLELGKPDKKQEQEK
jgi:hypothetical protein